MGLYRGGGGRLISGISFLTKKKSLYAGGGAYNRGGFNMGFTVFHYDLFKRPSTMFLFVWVFFKRVEGLI